jgi:biotin operon repressor
MGTSEDLLIRLLATAQEQLRWQRASVLPQVRETIHQALETAQMRRAYELCDGTRSGSEIGSAVGTTKQTISKWTRRWRELGIAYDTEERRVRHLISLDALGLPVDVGGEKTRGRGSGRTG